MARFGFCTTSSLIWGGWGFAVPFYFVQDSRSPRIRNVGHGVLDRIDWKFPLLFKWLVGGDLSRVKKPPYLFSITLHLVDSEDDYRTGRNLSHCQRQQSYAELRWPGWSYSAYLWNQTSGFKPFTEKINVGHFCAWNRSFCYPIRQRPNLNYCIWLKINK